MAERSKAHAWKVCIGQKPIVGSNPTLSASRTVPVSSSTSRPGDHRDGDGLSLRVGTSTASWVFRFTAWDGKRREGGFGSADRQNRETAGLSLQRARKRAEEARKLLDPGVDPIDLRRDRQAADKERVRAAAVAKKAETMAVRKYARAYHAEHVEPIRTDKHAAQWIASIERHVPDSILDAPLAGVRAADLLDRLVPVLRKTPETGSRVRQRLETIFNAAVIDGLIDSNPATPIKRELLRRAGRHCRGKFASLPYAQAPAFLAARSGVPGTAGRCLEFLILTAARTSEALEVEWPEIDRQGRTGTIPAAKMKARQVHTVHLSDAALAVLGRQEGQHARWVFSSPVNLAAPMSNMAMLLTISRHSPGTGSPASARFNLRGDYYGIYCHLMPFWNILSKMNAAGGLACKR